MDSASQPQNRYVDLEPILTTAVKHGLLQLFLFYGPYLWILDVSHKADMEEAGDCLLEALQANNKGLSLHRQVEYYLPIHVKI